ncbi:hypothetical protein AXW28_15280 [Yersinia ruckeri]|uniref:Protein of uncharacterized function (DUF1120) n=3 Tax=Yersinia ruckeri TaxID=29486 RepID=A0A380QQJ8_YERRU|nr:hypothetical protein QMA0440_03203 [Yersinia ruckeri]EEP98259.1 hypothetical protein yruck0001_26280 [Yersinia ruckeri ATCC 29473]AUQ41173.1 DUF1120 domain-containing protein [Yersinia ruckeri]KFE39813.1 hypothetical protein nADLYRO1b_845 [Yersinia ruckeri]KGA49308.1 hypothetical protein DJ39_178 [Yersinia ruckeri ATCC 29473]
MGISIMKINKIATFILSATLLPSAFSATPAPSSAEIKVTGSIVPGACILEVPGNALNYGMLKIDELTVEDNGLITLEKKSLDYRITCPQRTAVKIKLTDHRSDTIPDKLKDSNMFGLGKGIFKDGVEVGFGGYQVQLDKLIVDGNVASLDSAEEYISPNQSVSYQLNNINATGKSFTGRYNIKPQIINLEDFNISTGIKLDGLVTMDVEYF